ncbi:MAG: DMT family transporter [Desulfosarcinaceae bacterium]|nr:DMT family transporter [Desulfosarcinaceae bacterium]
MRIPLGSALVLIAAVLFGTTGTSQALAPSGIQPLSTGALRVLIGGPALLLLAGLRGQLVHLSTAVPKRWLLLAAVGVAAYQIFFFKAVATTGVAVGTLVTMGSSPVIAGLFGRVVGERLDRNWAVCTLLATAGCILMVLPGASASLQVDPVGILLGLSASSGYCLYLLAARRVTNQMPALLAIAVILCLAAILTLPNLAAAHWDLWLTPRGISVALFLGLFATAAAYLLLTIGLSTTPMARTATLMLAEPLVAALLGIFLLAERVALMSGVGMGLLLCGLVWMALARR